MVPPILQQLIFNREPEQVLHWVERIAQWPIQRMIGTHYANNVMIRSSNDIREAFDFLFESPSSSSKRGVSWWMKLMDSLLDRWEKKEYDEEELREKAFQKDLIVLRDVSRRLIEQGLLFPERYASRSLK